VLKVKQRGYAPCSPQKAFTQVKLLLAQQQVGRSKLYDVTEILMTSRRVKVSPYMTRR
jgi:hypothetical protein